MSVSGPHVIPALDSFVKKTSLWSAVPDQPSKDGDEAFLFTFKPRVAVSLNITDTSGILSTWFAPTFKPLTSSMIWDERNGRYAAVLAHHDLIVWNGDEKSLEKVPARKFEQKISDLLLSRDGTECFVTFESGQVQRLDFVLDQVDPTELLSRSSLLPAKSQLLRSKIFHFRDHLYVVHILKEDAGATMLKSFQIKTDPDTGILSLHEVGVEREQKKCTFVNVLNSYQGPAMIYVDAEQFLNIKTLIGQDSVTTKVKLENAFNNASLRAASDDPEYLTLVGERAKKESILFVVSLKYSVIVATTVIPGNVCTEKQGQGLIVHKEKNFVLTDTSVYQMTTSNLPRDLDQMIGMLDKQKINTGGGKGGLIPNEKIEYFPVANLYDILPRLFEKQDVQGIAKMLTDDHVDIPESLVLNIIEFLLHIPDSKLLKKSDSTSVQLERERLLGLAFTVPITEQLMFQYMGQIEFGVAIEMLHFLDLALKLETGEHSDTFVQYIDWISLIISAHYSNILITKNEEALDLIKSISETVLHFEQSSVFHSSLIPLVKLMMENRCPTQGVTNKAYCIEIINL